jgi:transposase
LAVSIPMRSDFRASRLRALAAESDRVHTKRLLALAAIYDGATRTEAAQLSDVDPQTIRSWVVRFNAQGPDGLLRPKAQGRPSKLNDAQRKTIADLVNRNAVPVANTGEKWELADLTRWIIREFGIKLAKRTLSRELCAMGCALPGSRSDTKRNPGRRRPARASCSIGA